MKKEYLISYKPEKFQALNSDGITYVLKIRVVKFFGLIKTFKESKYTILEYANFNKYIEHWDSLIKTRKPL